MEYIVENGVLKKCIGDEKDIFIPEGVEKIDYFCFDTRDIQRITVPKSFMELKYFHRNRFDEIEEINVDEEHTEYSSIDGVVYNKDKSELVMYPVAAKRSEFTVPETVLDIRAEAFYETKHLKTIDLRNTKHIGSEAFYYSSVEKVYLDKVEIIDSGAFKWSKLKHFDFPSTLREIGVQAFDCNIQKCITVPNSVEFVSVNCFERAKEISIFDNLRVRATVPEWRWRNLGRISKEYKMFVYSAADESLRYVVPMFPDGTWKMNEILTEAWNKEGCFDFHALDSYFKEIKEPESKKQIAVTRLKWPSELEDAHREVYIKYLSRNAKKILTQCIDDSDIEDFMFFKDLGLLKKNIISDLVEHAAEKNATEFTAVLLNDAGGAGVSLVGKKALDNLDFDREMNKKEPKKKLSEKAKTLLFENTLLTGSVEDIKNCYDSIGMIEMPARSLGMACRFKGLVYVKALVEMGFTFSYDDTPSFVGKYDCAYTTAGFYRVVADYMLLLLDDCKCQSAYGIHRGYLDYQGQYLEDEYKNLTVISEEERADIIEYLYSTGTISKYSARELLYYSILSLSEYAIKKLKSLGVTIPERQKQFITDGGKGLDFEDYQNSLYRNDTAELKKQFEYWLDEIDDDEKIIINKTYAERHADQLFSPEVYSVIKNRADLSRVSRKTILEHFVDTDNSISLSLLLDNGWVNKRQLRDELIDRAAEKTSAGAEVALIDYKNKTGDPVLEQLEDEKKNNLDKNSVEYLKQNWAYEKLENGTLRIKKYRGYETIVKVPEKIGKAAVSTIGYKAFSPAGYASYSPLYDSRQKWRINEKEAEARRNINSVIIPEGVTTIEEGAFYKCDHLKECVMPDSVKTIGDYAFYGTAIESLVLPCSLSSIGEYAFRESPIETITIPDSLKVITRNAFDGCKNLKTVDLGNGLEKVDFLAFYHCENLAYVIVRNNNIEINGHAFSDTKLLNSHDVGDIVLGGYVVALDGSSSKYLEKKESEKQCDDSNTTKEPPFDGQKFVTTGLTAADERWVQEQVESRGGEYKPKFVVSLNYLIYNPDYGHETVKYTKAKEQINKGKNVKIITLDEFKKILK